MKAIEAAKLRKNWKARGNPHCSHSRTELEITSPGYLTGRYVCTICGARLPVQKQSRLRKAKSSGKQRGKAP
jgi:transposase-like protein